MLSRFRERSRNEEGMALIGVILLLILASGVCAALALSGQTETKAAYNLDVSAQAEAAAQAGLAAAAQAIVAELNSKLSMGSTVTQAIDALLDNDGSLADLGVGLLAPTSTNLLGSFPDIGYRVQAMDDDNWSARGMGSLSSTMLSAVQTRITENGSATGDGNQKIVIRSTGFGRGNTVVSVEATLTQVSLPAVVTNGDLTINGNIDIIGAGGGVHSNSDLTINGGSASIAQQATASGTADIQDPGGVGGDWGGGRPTLTIPPVNAIDYYDEADYILNDDGIIYLRSGMGLGAPQCTLATCSSLFGWDYDGSGDWSSTTTMHAGTYYAKGDVRMSGNFGLVSLTVIAEGNIHITGNPDIEPDAPELLFVTNGDLRIAGSLSTTLTIEGQVLVREQFFLHGNASIAGQILVEDRYNLSSLVDANSISGNPQVSYGGTSGTQAFTLGGWREVR